MLQNDLDPDNKLYADLCSCDFYSECTLNNKLIKIPNVNSTNLSLSHLNIHSLPAHTDELKNLFASIDCKFSVVGISETWLFDSYTNVDFDGYNFIQNCRHGWAEGGVGLYLDNSMAFEMRYDFFLDSLEWNHCLLKYVEIKVRVLLYDNL